MNVRVCVSVCKGACVRVCVNVRVCVSVCKGNRGNSVRLSFLGFPNHCRL